MKETFKILLYSAIAIVALLLITSLSANIIIKSKIEKLLSKDIPENVNHSYEDISVRSLCGSLIITKPSFVFKNKENKIAHTFLKAEKFKVSGISYWKLLFSKEVSIENISLINPEIIYYKDRKQKDTIKNGKKLENQIFIKGFELKDAGITIYDDTKDSLFLSTKKMNLKISNFEIGQKTIENPIPFQSEAITIYTDSLFLKSGKYENLRVEHIEIKDDELQLKNVHFFTKYSKDELSKIIPHERDHYNIEVPVLSVSNFKYGFNEKEDFFASAKMVALDHPDVDVYRDKTVKDDETFKPLYSRSLRELPFGLTVDSVKVRDAEIKYTERVHEDNLGGQITFKDLNAGISDVSNTYASPTKTRANVKALFMDTTPFTALWEFDVNNTNDHFLFQAQVNRLDASRMNQFTEPNIRVKFEGFADKTYFTIDGNNENSKTNLRIEFSDLKVILVDKETHKKRKILSAMANVLVSKNSENRKSQYEEASGEAVRNKTQSVFNQLWISLESALKKALI